MAACPACDASLPEAAKACAGCGTVASFSFDTAKGTQGQATRTANQARKDIGLVRATGVEPATAERLVDKADAELRQTRFPHALAYAQAARRAVTIAKTRARLQEDLARAEEAVRLAKQGGADTSTAQTALQEAADALAAGNLKSVPTWLKRASVRAAEETKVKSAESVVAGAAKAVRYAKERGADVAAAEQELARAKESYGEKPFGAAREAATKAREAAERSRKHARYEKFVASAEHAIEVARKSGADLAESRRIVSEARHALKDALFAEAQGKAAAAKESIAEAKRYRVSEVLIERTEKAARKEERRGIDVGGPALVLVEAHQALEVREYRKVREFARDAREAIKDAVIVHRLKAALASLATDVGELKTIGAEAADAEALLAEATAALEAQDFDKCQRLSSRCRRAADDAREARRQEIVVSTIQKIVTAAAASGQVDIQQVRDLIQDVEAMVAGGEAVNVEELVKSRLTVVDAEKLREANQRLADTRLLLLDLKRADIDIAGSDEILEHAGIALKEGRFDDADKQIAELEDMAGTLIQTLMDSSVETLQAAHEAADKARRAGIPIPDAIRMLNSADAAMAAGNVYEALEFGRIAQARAETAWKRHFEEESKRDVDAMKAISDRLTKDREKADQLLSHIDYLTSIGVDVAPARESLASAQKALEEKRPDEVEAHLEATERIIEGMRGALRKSTEDALHRLQKDVADARAQGLMTPEMEAVLLRAEEAIREDQHREAVAAMKALGETIEHAREERAAEVQRKQMERAKKASDRFVRVKRMVEELKRANIDIQGSDEALLDAEKALQARDFETSDQLLEDLESTAREMRAELVAATRFLLSKARESVDAAAQAGLDMAEAVGLLQNADGFLAKGKLDDAVESANTAKQRADAAQRLKTEEDARTEKVRVETAREKIERLRKIMADLHRADITVDGADQAMAKAEEALAAKRYEEVHIVLADAESLAESLREGLRAAAEELLARSAENVEAARKEGLNVRRADMVLANAQAALQEGRFVEAIEYHKVIDDICADAKRLREFRELEAEVQVLRTEVLRIAALGGDTKGSEELLSKAQEEVSLGRYERVAEYTKQIRDALSITRKQILEGRLDRARLAIGRAQLLGANVADAEALLPDAQKAVDAGNWEALDLLVRRIEEKSAKASESFLAAKAEEDYLALQDLAKQVGASGLDVPEAARFLEDARKLKEERDFASMADMIGEARKVLEASSRAHIVAEYRKRMRGLTATIEAAKRIGANVREAERILQQVESAIHANDLSLADILVKQAEVSTGLLVQTFIQNKYPNLSVKTPSTGLQANAWNRFVVEIANRGTLGAKDIELRFDGDLEVRGAVPIPEIAVDETRAIELGVKPTREGDVPVNVRVFYNRYFDDNRYEVADARSLRVESAGTYVVEDVFLIHTDGRLISHESRKFRQEIDEDIFSGMLTVVQDFIRDSFKQRTATGIRRLDFGQSKILIERSPHCFLATVVLGSEPALMPLYMAEILREIEREYGETLGNWSGMIQDLPGIDEVIQRLVLLTATKGAERGALGGSEVAELERLLNAARESGAETMDVEELLAKAENTLDVDLELAWQLLSKAKLQVRDSQEKFMDRVKLLVNQTEETVEQLRGLGADAGPAEILLKEAREAFEAGRYDKVEEIAGHIKGTLERVQQDTNAKRVEVDLQALIQEIERARTEGADVSRADAFLVKIEDALQRKNFRAVEDHMRRARDSVRDERKKAILKRSSEEMERLTAMLVEGKEFGAEAAEAEGLLLRAREALADARADDLDAIVRQASAVAKQSLRNFLEDRYPRLFVSMPASGIQAEAWNKFVLELTNKGNLAAKDVDVRFGGDVEVRGLEPIPQIGPNEKRRIEIGVRPKAAGSVPVDVEIRYVRPLDNKPYELVDSRHLRTERPGTYLVEDAFLIHRDGRLIAHESRQFRDAMDEDIFSGMLTVVLDHVKKTMATAGGSGLKRIDFGSSKILFERGPNAYLAATVAGGEPVALPIYLVDTLREIEERFGERLDKWTGFLSELEGVQELIRRILYVSEVPEADLGPLTGAALVDAMRLVSEAAPEEQGSDFVREARAVIEAKDFPEASEFVRKAMASYAAGREELHAQLREAVTTHGEMVGLQLSDDQLKAYIDVVRRVVEAVNAAREKAGMDKVWPVKRVAVKVEVPDALDAIQSFRKIIVNQSGAKELDIVPPGETWRGLKLHLNLDSEAIAKAYRLWARKIEILLRSQDAWKIKQGLDKGEYNLGVEGQKVRVDPSMVWFTETTPDNVVEETFDGGKIYVDTEMTEDIMAEGYARELVNIIRDVRGELKLTGDVWIETKIKASESLNRLLRKWKDFISHETNTQALKFVRGDISDGYVVECSLGTESFTVSVKPVEGIVASA